MSLTLVVLAAPYSVYKKITSGFPCSTKVKPDLRYHMYSIVYNQTWQNIALGAPEPIDRSQLSIYQRGWWSDIISKVPGYQEINVFLGNKVAGSLAYIISKPSDDAPLGFALSGFNLRELPWTHLSGPILASGLSINEQKAVATELVRRVPRSISATFVYDSDDPYAELYGEIYKNAGFSMTIQQNFREPSDALDVLGRMSREERKKNKGRTELS